jgi:acetyl esterase/lipase
MPSLEMDAAAERFAGVFPHAAADGRAAYDAMGAALPPDAETRIEPTDVGGAGGPHSEWQWWDGVDEDRVLLYLHGGGYAIGRPLTWRQFGGRLSRLANVRLLNFDYRLAPEHPFPAAFDDALAAYRWLLLGGWSAERMAFAGDSAGGGLAVALMAALRDAGEPLPAACFVVAPWADLTNTGASMDDPEVGDPNPEGRALAEMMASQYLAGHDPLDPRVSPIFGDLTGLPPVHIELARRDGICSDAERLEAALRAAGNAVTLTATAGAVHGFPAFVPESPESRAAIPRLAGFLQAHLA